jgi:protein CpxP
MKKKLIACVVFMIAVSFSFAQGGGQRQGGMQQMNPEERAKRTVEQLTEQLKLNAAQKDSVYKYSMEQSKAQQALFNQSQGGGDRESMRAAMTKLTTATDAKINAILTDAQKTDYEKIIAERANRRRPGGGQ